MTSTLALVARAQDTPSLYPHAALDGLRMSSVAIAPNGRVAALGSDDGECVILDIEANRTIRRARIGHPVRAIAFGSAGADIFIAAEDALFVLDPLSGAIRAQRAVHNPEGLLDVLGSAVVTAAGNGAIDVWSTSLQSLGHFTAPDLYKQQLRLVLAGRNGSEYLASSSDGLAMWTLGTAEPVRALNLTRQNVLAAGRDPQGELVALAIKSLSLRRERLAGNPIGAVATFTVRAIDWTSGRTVKEVAIDDDDIGAVAVAPNRAVVLVGTPAAVRVVDLQAGREVGRLQVPGRPTRIVVSADGAWVVAELDNGRGQVWRASGLAAHGPATRTADAESVLPGAKYIITPSTEPVIQPAEHSTLAVLDLENLGVDAAVARAVGSVLAGRLATSDRVQLVERAAIDAVLKELRLQNTGVTSATTAAQLGKMLNAERVLLGSVNALGSTMIISIRLVRTETARVETARDVTCNNCRLEDIPRAITLLVESIVGSGR